MTQPHNPSEPDTGGHATEPAAEYTPITDSEPRPLPAPVAPQVTALNTTPRPVPESNSPIDGIVPDKPIARATKSKRNARKAKPATPPAQAAPEPEEAQAPAATQKITARMASLGAHLMLLKPEVKRPVAKGWPLAVAVSVDDADAHLAIGGNLGVNLSLSRFIVLDAEDYASTAAVTDAGFTLTVVPAKAQANYTHDPDHDKRGGSHTWLRVPDGIDASELPADQIGIKLACGGVIDVLAGVRYVVAPPSRLAEAPEYRYAVCQGGPLDPAVYTERPEADLAEAPMWLFDKSVPCPPGLEPLHGCLAPKTARERVEADARSQERTDEIDAVPWDLWLDGDPRLTLTGEIDGCGCPIWHWAGADNSKSATLHEGCTHGHGVHVWSGSMIGQLELDHDHLSRLDLSVALTGMTRKEAAARVGITLGADREPLAAVLPEHYEQYACTAEAAGQARQAAQFREAAAVMRAQARIPGTEARGGEVFLRRSTTMIGGPGPAELTDLNLDELVLQPAAVGDRVTVSSLTGLIPPAPGAAAAAEPIEEDPGPEVEPLAGVDTGKALMRDLEELDRRTGIWDMLPFLRNVAAAADSRGVGRWGLLGALQPRIACRVPPHVRLVGADGCEGGPNSGTSLNTGSILVGAPETGKSETIKVAADLIPLPTHAKLTPSGTGEGIIKTFGYMRKSCGRSGEDDGGGDIDHDAAAAKAKDVDLFDADYEFHQITDTVLATIPEASDLSSETGRQGTRLLSVYRCLWMGETVGTATGEIDRRTFLAPHTARFGAVIGAQPEPGTLGVIIAEGPLGTPQRFGFYLVKVDMPNGAPPITSLDIPPVNWSSSDGGGGHVAELIGSLLDRDPNPVWIHWPPAAAAAIRANRAARQADAWKAFSIAEVRSTRSEGAAEDAIREARGHELLHQLKVAAILAIADGLREPTDLHWAAAGVVMEHRAILFRGTVEIVAAKAAAKNAATGVGQGQQRAAARRAEKAAERQHLSDTATRVIEVLAEIGQPSSEAEIRRRLGKAQGEELGPLLSWLCSSGMLVTPAMNRRRLPLYWLPGVPVPVPQ